MGTLSGWSEVRKEERNTSIAEFRDASSYFEEEAMSNESVQVCPSQIVAEALKNLIYRSSLP